MEGISKSQVSRLRGEIDERVQAFLSRPLEGDWPYVWLDATYINIRSLTEELNPALMQPLLTPLGGTRPTRGRSLALRRKGWP